MTMVDTERLHTAQLLYGLRDRLDAELTLRCIRRREGNSRT